jgi:hypothetical protein
MRPVLTLTLLAATLTAIAMSPPPPPDTPVKPTAVPLPKTSTTRPTLKFDTDAYDFGTTNAFKTLTGTFTFHNVSSVPLKFKQPQTTCGCAVARVTPDCLQPGARGELEFNLNLSLFMRGPVEKLIYLETEPAGFVNVLHVKANLIPLYDTDPLSLNFNDIRIGSRTNATVRLWRNDTKPLEITRLAASQSNVTARLEPIATNNTARLQIDFRVEGPPRWFYERVYIFSTLNPTQEVAAVPIYARIVGDVVLSREEIYWAVVNLEQPGFRTLRVKASDPTRQLEIKNLACSLPYVALETAPGAGGVGYEITARLRRLPAATERGAITFDTNMPTQPRITVPLIINMLRF